MTTPQLEELKYRAKLMDGMSMVLPASQVRELLNAAYENEELRKRIEELTRGDK